ncbi:hypothetical protein CLOP_g18892 [Closterium sp. NIES-67]|nr:hypothetical protein CLOP_g18892 [Closterium sp. NIES-67]
MPQPRQLLLLTIIGLLAGVANLPITARAQNGTRVAAGSWNCDISKGWWISANRHLPLYTGLKCPYIRSSQNCQNQGRPDLQFQKYKWVPSGCTVQRMTPKRLLTRLRNKLVLVFGDSVSKNFAGSVACVLHAASPSSIQDFRVASGNTKAYGVKVPRFNARFASVFSNWLNQASGLGGSMNRVDLDKIDPQITDLLPLADIVVFQATNWWFPAINKWYVGGKEQSLSKEAAYEIGLKTLRDYVAKSGFKGRAALLGVSPSHYKVPGLKEGSCETSKILTAAQAQEFAKGDITGNKFREIQKRVLSGSPIRYVDVAPMSNYRPDGHVQKWMQKGGAPPGKRNDCLHWCEGGVTDAWLEMLFNNLLF